jgi:hypothetical protein
MGLREAVLARQFHGGFVRGPDRDHISFGETSPRMVGTPPKRRAQATECIAEWNHVLNGLDFRLGSPVASSAQRRQIAKPVRLCHLLEIEERLFVMHMERVAEFTL